MAYMQTFLQLAIVIMFSLYLCIIAWFIYALLFYLLGLVAIVLVILLRAFTEVTIIVLLYLL